MKTDELMDLLARAPAPATPAHPAQRMIAASVTGMAVAVAAVLSLMGINPALASDLELAMFWVKLATVLAVLVVAVAASARLSQPGRQLGFLPLGLALPVAALLGLALAVLVDSSPQERAALLMGRTWQVCSLNIALLALPTLALGLAAMKSMAPTRLRTAGAAAGLMAGAAGALAYTLHCPELDAPFLAAWYLPGMLLPAALGALLGTRALRW